MTRRVVSYAPNTGHQQCLEPQSSTYPETSPYLLGRWRDLSNWQIERQLKPCLAIRVLHRKSG